MEFVVDLNFSGHKMFSCHVMNLCMYSGPSVKQGVYIGTIGSNRLCNLKYFSAQNKYNYANEIWH